MANKLLTSNLSEMLEGATSVRVDISSGPGHLTIDRLAAGEPVLASGTLEYFEQQGPPARSLDSQGGQATLAVKAGKGSVGQSWLRLPWAGCGGAYEWQVHLNPAVPSDITAHSGGGNVKLDLARMAITHLVAESGGGNVEVALPDNAASLGATVRTGGGNVRVEVGHGTSGNNAVEATSGAGNVVVLIPSGIAARIHARSGLGKVALDSRFAKIEKDTYQSPDYDSAANRVEITVRSGAGNVSVSAK